MKETLIRNLENQIEFRDFKLNSLLEVTKAINSNRSVEEITRLFEFIVSDQLGFDRFVLFHKQEEWSCLSRVGYKGKFTDLDIEEDLARFSEITIIESSKTQLLNESQVKLRNILLIIFLKKSKIKKTTSRRINYLIIFLFQDLFSKHQHKQL